MNQITINGAPYVVADDELKLSLLEYLRERRFLTGTKNGCEKGLCGSCTVIVDGKALRSCRTPVEKAIGKSVVTIEGMEGPGGEPHPIQKAFMDAGAIQCGFCTPGMVMSAYALLLRDPDPSRDDIRKALKGNLCRCTGYQQIVDAVSLAAKVMREQALPVEAGCLRKR
ncbi:MAG TPA: (2Fe-2S)-binding protein [Spirochaetia bacterium]|nr:(2Fe-2S)-binding protein [Spirochaetaceae bacterium]HPE89336.1 (2Fe-2S)-binding protein [Spirochaetales bacterium]HRW24853.1 (2Fe-2S)-binding protein [Spirochaetia bacterium]